MYRKGIRFSYVSFVIVLLFISYKCSFSPSLQSSIQAVTTTENADNPENGLEALAQVVSCEDIIGWRSRDATGIERGLHRVVLFLTDDQFHYSGEGRVSHPQTGKS